MKYDVQKRLEAVQAYLAGAGGWKAIAQEYGVEATSLRNWVAAFREHGEAGLERKYRGQNYSADFKLEVLTRMVDEGLSCRQAAVLFNIRRVDSIGTWRRRYDEGGFAALATPSRQTETTVSVHTKPPAGRRESDSPEPVPSRDELLQELERLRAENAYLKKLDALVRTKKSSAQRKKC